MSVMIRCQGLTADEVNQAKLRREVEDSSTGERVLYESYESFNSLTLSEAN